jgi:hypothetical protein
LTLFALGGKHLYTLLNTMPRPLKNQSRPRRRRRILPRPNGRVRLVGGYLPQSLFQGIAAWTARDPERNLSGFLREAIREKLAGDGIAFAGPASLLPAPAPGPGGSAPQLSKTQ